MILNVFINLKNKYPKELESISLHRHFCTHLVLKHRFVLNSIN